MITSVIFYQPSKPEGLGMDKELREEIQKWRDDAFEAAAQICERYGASHAADDIRALKSKKQE